MSKLAYKNRHGRLVAEEGEGNHTVFAAYSFKTDRYKLALPDNTVDGFNLVHFPELIEEDVRNLVRALGRLLTQLDSGVVEENLAAEAQALYDAELAEKLARATPGHNGNGKHPVVVGAPELDWHRIASGRYEATTGEEVLAVEDTGAVDSSQRWVAWVDAHEVGRAPLYREAKALATAAAATKEVA